MFYRKKGVLVRLSSFRYSGTSPLLITTYQALTYNTMFMPEPA